MQLLKCPLYTTKIQKSTILYNYLVLSHAIKRVEVLSLVVTDAKPCQLSNFIQPFRRNVLIGCNGYSPIKVNENFTPPSSFQRFQICPDIVFLQLTFVNCIMHYTVDYRCITCCSITPDNSLLSFAV